MTAKWPGVICQGGILGFERWVLISQGNRMVRVQISPGSSPELSSAGGMVGWGREDPSPVLQPSFTSRAISGWGGGRGVWGGENQVWRPRCIALTEGAAMEEGVRRGGAAGKGKEGGCLA